MEEGWGRVPAHMSKRERQHVVSCATQLQHAMNVRPVGRRLRSVQPALYQELPLKIEPRRPGPYRFLEVFTWTCALSRVAGDTSDWEVWEPVTLPTWDFQKPTDRAAAWDYIQKVDPDALWVAWPCGPWSVMQYINMRTPAQRRKLHMNRQAARALLQFTAQLAEYQSRRGRLFMGENPQSPPA
jgi:hypothetical protein